MNAKKKFTMPTSYVIIFGVIVLIAILTWFIPDITISGISWNKEQRWLYIMQSTGVPEKW